MAYFRPLTNVDYKVTFPYGDFQEKRSRYPEDVPENEKSMQYAYSVSFIATGHPETDEESGTWYTDEFCHKKLQEAHVVQGAIFIVCHQERGKTKTWMIRQYQNPSSETSEASSPSSNAQNAPANSNTQADSKTPEVALQEISRLFHACHSVAVGFFDENTDPCFKLAYTFYAELRKMGFDNMSVAPQETPDGETAQMEEIPLPPEYPSMTDTDDLPF